MRTFIAPLFFTLSSACALAPGQSADSAGTDQSEWNWGSAGTSTNSGSSSDDTDEAADTAETDTATEDTAVEDTGDTASDDTAAADLVTAKVGIYPHAEYDVSSASYGVSTPQICMFDVVVDSVFPSDYGSCVATGYNAYMADSSVEYTPGGMLIINAKWNDSIRDRYFAEYGGVVNAIELRVVVEFPDGAWQAYAITGAAPTEPGTAGWSANGDGSGGEVHVWTFEDSLDHRDE